MLLLRLSVAVLLLLLVVALVVSIVAASTAGIAGYGDHESNDLAITQKCTCSCSGNVSVLNRVPLSPGVLTSSGRFCNPDFPLLSSTRTRDVS